MAFYMEGNDEWKRQQMLRQQRSFFPNANPGAGTQQFPLAPGVAEGQARMNQIANTSTYKSRRAAGSMVTSPSGGSMFVPSGQFQNYQAQGYQSTPPALDAAQRFDLGQAYAQGYGAPQPSIQQGPGGPYRVAGGVAAPYTPPNIFQRFGADLRGGAQGLGTFAANLGTQFQNAFNTANSFFTGNRPTQSTQSQNFYAYNPSPVPRKPNRYFDY